MIMFLVATSCGIYDTAVRLGYSTIYNMHTRELQHFQYGIKDIPEARTKRDNLHTNSRELFLDTSTKLNVAIHNNM